MKKLLCVLMFGMVFGQDAISTKEITIPIDENTEMIDIGNYVDLESGFYTVKLIFLNVINDECANMEEEFRIEFIPEYGAEDISIHYCGFPGDCSDLGFHNGISEMSVNYENGILNATTYYQDEVDCAFSLELILRVSGRFDDTDVGLQGDMNDDDSLDVIDVVMLVDVIINGGVGDIGDLLNIVTG